MMYVVQIFGSKQLFSKYNQRTQLHTSKMVPGYKIGSKNQSLLKYVAF